MRKTILFAMVLGIMALSACNDNKKQQENMEAETSVQSAPADSAFQEAAAGDYKSYDGSKVITLNKDLTVTTKNCEKYYSWELIAQPQDSVAAIYLNKKGIDADIQAQAQLDLVEGALTIKNETFRKDNTKK